MPLTGCLELHVTSVTYWPTGSSFYSGQTRTNKLTFSHSIVIGEHPWLGANQE